MNKQVKYNKDGTIKSRGIEWADFFRNGNSFTANPIAGCEHGCRWEMADGKIVVCYAETTAEDIAKSAYPQGFAHNYWRPNELAAMRAKKDPSGIFVGSMSDVFGSQVPIEQIMEVLDVSRELKQHVLFYLTKNITRAKEFDIPNNCWIGTSVPPDFMFGKSLNDRQKDRMMIHSLDQLKQLRENGVPITWLSIEPLSRDWTPVFEEWLESERSKGEFPVSWVVIGAGSDGKKYYQPEPIWIQNLLEFMDRFQVPVYMKGNLKPSQGIAFDEWREDYPDYHPETDGMMLMIE